MDNQAEAKRIATNICKTLFDAEYIAYFAGGWVRDLLLDNPTDEIDIATSAPPEIIQKLFNKTIPVGARFGVIIVVISGWQFEVTTFRKDHPYLDGRHPDGIDYSTPEKDAHRRDFTINGMFYDPLSDTIYDYVDGKKDLKNKVIRAIGNPEERFKEDRLRMIRAARFAARLRFQIDNKTKESIREQAPYLFPSVSMERVWQEFNKMASYPGIDQALLLLHELYLLPVIFPQLQTLSLEELKIRVSPFPYFPIACPTIVYLLELFDTIPPDLCIYLKTTTADAKLVDFFIKSKQLFDRAPQDFEWARFYAHPDSEFYLQVQQAKMDVQARLKFIAMHDQKKINLHEHILRLQKGKPLLQSHHLKQLGIKPGKRMGELLKLAEQIAINENHHSPEIVIQRLKDEVPDFQ